jgi:hypothetical protein
MVLTRLRRVPLSQLKKSRLFVSPTRHLSSLSDKRLRKKGQTTTKTFADLPDVYVNETGVAAAPLPDWNPTYLVPPADPGWFSYMIHEASLTTQMQLFTKKSRNPSVRPETRTKIRVNHERQRKSWIQVGSFFLRIICL